MKKTLLTIITLLSFNIIFSQNVGIGTISPDPSAQLDVYSSSKGFLPPRLTAAQRDSIRNPIAGLQIWCINCCQNGEMEVYNGITWTNMNGGGPCSIYNYLQISTLPIDSITSSTAVGGGLILNSGGSAINTKGLVWSTTHYPTINLSTKTIDSSVSENFRNRITLLIPNKTYYLRAYATNSFGTGYGNEISFTTNELSIPTLNTNTVSSITTNSAVSGGLVISDGGAPITAKGVCWSLNNNPTIIDSKTNDGTGVGSFISQLSQLLNNTKYYFRAYASNSLGTAYGNLDSFKTAQVYNVGQSYQGGIIGYILQPEDPGYDINVPHGIIVAPSDQGTSFWACGSCPIIGNTLSEIGTGLQNTNNIVNACTVNVVFCNSSYTAARICYDLVLNDFSDWYLPSINELDKLYANRNLIGGFSSGNYWSSTEYGGPNAWYIWFSSGQRRYNDFQKTNTLNIRAIRSF
jgi:hypothetical protein